MRIRATSFSESEDQIRFIRDTVFGMEQEVPRDLDWDGEDATCVHVIAEDGAGNPVGTGRMKGEGKIGRLAVLSSWRGKGLGGKMLTALIHEARARELNRVYLHAQSQAVAFYENHGFLREGPAFFEAGMLHVKMIKEL